MKKQKVILAESQDTSAFDSGAKMQMQPVGVSGSELFAGYFSEEYLQKIRGRKGAKQFDEIRRSEAQVAMLLNAVMNPIKAAAWEFEAADPTFVPDAETHKKFVEYNAKDCIDWETHLHEALTMLTFGYSIFECIHSVVFNHPKFGTFNGLKALAFRSQKTIEKWVVDPATGELQTVVQWAQGDLVTGRSALMDMPAEHLVIFTNQKEGDNYEGISVLRPMYGAWYRKNLYLKIAAIGMEKGAIGTPVGTPPAGKLIKADFEEFKKTLQNFTANESAYIIKPQGWEIEIKENNFDPAKVKEMILLENTEMVNSLVANFLSLGTSGGGGSYALGTDLSDFFLSGIQCYANIIAGVWNRKIIPNLIKLNYGEQVEYPKLKVTQINDKAGKELAEIVKSFVDSKVIKPDTPLEDYTRKVYKLPKADPTTARAADPAPAPYGNPRLTEKTNSIQLAESYKKQWKTNKDELKTIMQTNLTAIKESYKKQISSQWANVPKSKRLNIALNLEPKGVNAYKDALKEKLAEIATKSLDAAKKQTPYAKNLKLAEIKLAAPRGGYFDALPTNIKNIVKTQAELISSAQVGDLSKIVSFQYASSAPSDEDVDQILMDIDEAVDPVIEGSTGSGMSIDAAAGNATSTVANQASLEWFFEPEVLDGIESFTFVNEDPVSEICQELDGVTWAANDPDLDRYSPPLHHNCKSRLEPNLKGDEGNPEITGTGSLSAKALDSITLCECHGYNLSFKLAEKPDYCLADLTKEEQDLISAKIAKLIGEGKDQAQAVAIAYSMLQRGELGQ